MYTKQDAKMTQGLAILCMLVLHLFCRKGADVYGTPLIWLNDTTPLVYCFGFFAEICVPLYSLTAGYAQELLYEQGRSAWKDRLKRILKLMETYWIVVILFSVIGLLKQDSFIPGSFTDFLKTLVFLHSYNGAWWFLHSYVFMLLIPPNVLLWPVEHLRPIWGGALCAGLTVLWYLLGRFGLRLSSHTQAAALHFVLTEAENLIGIIPAVWFGALMCRHRLFDRAKQWMRGRIPNKNKQKWMFAAALMVIFIGFYVIHKAVLASFAAAAVFLIFNLWEKGTAAQRFFGFLGEHSTNIWLTHMFFYLVLFPGLVQKLRLPVLMLAGLLGLSLVASYGIGVIQRMISVSMDRSHNRHTMR